MMGETGTPSASQAKTQAGQSPARQGPAGRTPAGDRPPVRPPAAPDSRGAPLPPTLRRNAPLVPTDSAASRALAAVIAILTFLAALCAGAAEIVASSAVQWQGTVAQEVTIQVRPSPGRDISSRPATRRCRP